jgi:hypothetical protein
MGAADDPARSYRHGDKWLVTAHESPVAWGKGGSLSHPEGKAQGYAELPVGAPKREVREGESRMCCQVNVRFGRGVTGVPGNRASRSLPHLRCAPLRLSAAGEF